MLEINKRRFGQQQSVHERQQRHRLLRRVATAVVVLLVLMVGGSVAYVWYMGQHPVKTDQPSVVTGSTAPKIQAYAPDPNAPIGIVQQTFATPIVSGSNTSISIKTSPKAACQISVKMKETSLPDTGLVPKIADEFGIVDWSWTMPAGVLPGKWPVEITCANAAKKSAYYRAMLEVTR